MSMTEVMARLREKVKEDGREYLPWTCVILKEQCIEVSKSCHECKVFLQTEKDMRKKHA